MSDEPTLFEDQARTQPDASHRDGRKIVYDDSEASPDTLADGRFNGSGDWSRTAISKSIGKGEGFTHVELALWALYTKGRVTRRMFVEISDK